MKIMITDELLMSAHPHKLAGLIEAITGTKEDTCPAPIGIETSVQSRLRDAKVDRLDSSTDIGVFLHDDALTRARLRPYATGGVITKGIEFIRADGSKAHGDLYIDWSDPSGFGTVPA